MAQEGFSRFSNRTSIKLYVKISAVLLSSLIAIVGISAQAKNDATPSASPTASAAIDQANQEKIKNEKRRSIILYGIESEILDLLGELKTEKKEQFIDELFDLLKKTKSAKIKEGILSFYAEIQWKGAEEFASKIVNDCESYSQSLVKTAMSYLSAIKSSISNKKLRELIDRKDANFLIPAISALAKTGTDEDGKFLLTQLKRFDIDDAEKQELISALGNLKYLDAIEDITKLLKNKDEKKGTRMMCCEALGKMQNDKVIETLIWAIDDDDPNVRTSAIQALGNYTGANVNEAILSALRDSYVNARLEAIKQCGKMKIQAALLVLEYKVENDPEQKVKDESLLALGELGSREAYDYIGKYLADAKKNQAMRISSFSILARKDIDMSYSVLDKAFIDAQKDPVYASTYLAFAKIISTISSPRIESWVSMMLSDKNFIIQLYGIEAVRINRFILLRATLEKIAKESKDPLKKKAQEVLDSW